MTIRITHRDKNGSLAQQAGVEGVRREPPPRLRASYTALPTVFGVLGGPV